MVRLNLSIAAVSIFTSNIVVNAFTTPFQRATQTPTFYSTASSSSSNTALQAEAKKVIVLGGDGFCGWPTSLYLSDQGHDVVIVDNLSRRNIDIELGCDSLTPIQPPEVSFGFTYSIQSNFILKSPVVVEKGNAFWFV